VVQAETILTEGGRQSKDAEKRRDAAKHNTRKHVPRNKARENICQQIIGSDFTCKWWQLCNNFKRIINWQCRVSTKSTLDLLRKPGYVERCILQKTGTFSFFFALELSPQGINGLEFWTPRECQIIWTDAMRVHRSFRNSVPIPSWFYYLLWVNGIISEIRKKM